jgi:hypothetical protein
LVVLAFGGRQATEYSVDDLARLLESAAYTGRVTILVAILVILDALLICLLCGGINPYTLMARDGQA